MRLFFYYALHSFKNQLKKLLKSWVLLFLVVCALLGGAIGIGTSLLMDLNESVNEPSAEEEEEADVNEASDSFSLLLLYPDITPRDMAELACGGVIFILLFIQTIGADKAAGNIFLPADVPMLFASPLSPQAVLAFRLSTSLFLELFIGVYLLLDLPALMDVLSIPFWGALVLLLAFLCFGAIGTLLQVWIFVAASSHPRIKKVLRPALFAGVAMIGIAFYMFCRAGSDDLLPAAVSFFNAPYSRLIPVWGWLKGMCMSAVEGSVSGCLLASGLNLLTIAALLYAIRHTRADFYEEALHNTDILAEKMAAAASEKGNGLALNIHGKLSSKEDMPQIMRHGYGANVFFFKTMENRFRLAYGGILTKTAGTYIALGLLTACICRFFVGTKSIIPVALVLSALAFYRAWGDPLGEDTKMDYFRLIPESTWHKLFYSLLGGSCCCLLDALLALIPVVLLLGANPLDALCWLLFIVSVDFFSTNVGTFIHLSTPQNAGATVKQIVQAMLMYFGLLPDIIVLALALIFGFGSLAAILCTAMNLGLGFVFFAFSPFFLEPKGGSGLYPYRG